jgi:hypothetical protein
MSATPLIAALGSRDGSALEGLLADQVAFHSPVADYESREEIVRLFVTIGGVVENLRSRRVLAQGRETVTFVEGEVDGRTIDGVLDVIEGDDGRIAEVTLMLRPLDALLLGVKKMGAALGR